MSSSKWKKTVAALGLCMCISCSDCRKEFEHAKLKGEVMQQVVKKDAMDEYVERLKRYDKLSAEEKKALYNQIVEHIRGLDAQGKGEHVKEALEKLMIFLDNYTTKKSMDENGLIY
ncbi:MAG: hypothetical protein ACP5KJ_04310, partial [Candidatus Micrarchaeia archaeon]